MRTGSDRPRRGTPSETRQRLVTAAADLFNRVGFHGTDTNRIAEAAGYAAGTFYKHFPDKRAILLAAYEAWVTQEWNTIDELFSQARSQAELVAAIVDSVLSIHRRWRGLRASLRALIAQDEIARTFYRQQRRRQIEKLSKVRRLGTVPVIGDESPPEAEGGESRRVLRDAMLLYTLERVCDAIAEGEFAELGLSVAMATEELRAIVHRHFARDLTKPQNSALRREPRARP